MLFVFTIFSKFSSNYFVPIKVPQILDFHKPSKGYSLVTALLSLLCIRSNNMSLVQTFPAFFITKYFINIILLHHYWFTNIVDLVLYDLTPHSIEMAHFIKWKWCGSSQHFFKIYLYNGQPGKLKLLLITIKILNIQGNTLHFSIE